MDDTGQVLSEHLAQLSLDFLLQISTDDFDAVKGTAHIHVLEGIVLEYECDSFGLADDENEDRAKVEQGEFECHGHK